MFRLIQCTLLLAYTIPYIALPCRAAAAEVVYVSRTSQPNTTQLLPALQSGAATIILLDEEYALGNEFDQYIENPLRLNRNVTLTGLPGQLPILDLQFKPGILHICSNCIFRAHRIVLRNERAMGTSYTISIIQGETSSRVEMSDGYAQHYACLPTEATLAIFTNTARSALYPKSGVQQLVDVVNVTFKGTRYTNMVHMIDISSDISLRLLTGGAYVGGYALHRTNTTRLCDESVSEECLSSNSPEECLVELTDQMRSGGSGAAAAAAAAGDGSGGGGGRRLAAIVTPVVLAAVLLLLGGLLLWRRKVKLRQLADKELLLQQSGNALPPSASAAGHLDGHGSPAAELEIRTMAPSSITLAVPQQQHSDRSRPSSPTPPQPSFDSCRASFDSRGLSAARRSTSWEVTWCQTAPGLFGRQDPDDDDDATAGIELGPLLGAGSFARVFKGRWAGLDVAVKVIQHDSSTRSYVANEVQLMMMLNHPNIVRAYHCITKQLCQRHKQQQQNYKHLGSNSRQNSSNFDGFAAAAASTAGSLLTATQKPSVIENQKRSVHRNFGSMVPVLLQQQQFGVEGSHSMDSMAPTQHLLVDQQQQQHELSIIIPSFTARSAAPSEPHTPSELTPGFNIPSSGPFTQVTAATAAASTLSDSAIGTRTASDEYVRTLSGSWVSTTPHNSAEVAARYMRKETQQSSRAFAPQTLGSYPFAHSGRTAAAAAAAAAAAGSSKGQVTHLSDDLPRIGGQLSTIYSVSSGTTSNNSSSKGARTPSGNAAGAGSSSRSISDDHAGDQAVGGQRHMGSFRSTVLETISSSRGSTETTAAASLPSVDSHVAQEAATAAAAAAADVAAAEAEQAHSVVDLRPLIVMHQQQLQISDDGWGSPAAAPPFDDQNHDDHDLVACETWLVTEFCDRGTLSRCATDLKPTASDTEMLKLLLLLLDVARGLLLLHTNNIVHADLNGDNVLVSSSSTAPYGLVAKIADLGLSRVIKQQATHRTTRTVGTLSHQPPELLRDGHTSPAVDIYSFGIMMWELYTGEAAFANMRYGQIYHQVVILGSRPTVSGDMCEDYQLLMSRCWADVVEQRPSAEMVMHCIELMIQDRQQQQQQ